MAKLNSMIKIILEGVIIERDCTIVLDDDPNEYIVKQIIVHRDWKKSKIPPTDISDAVFDMISHSESNQLKDKVMSIIKRFGTDDDEEEVVVGEE